MTETKSILLTQGLVAIVDAADYEWLSRFKWRAYKRANTFYATRNTPLVNGKRTTVQMHREILGVGPDVLVDHKDGNGLNNTRSNLRPATGYQNSLNKSAQRNCVSPFKGVHWNKYRNVWQARIQFDGKRKHLGCFSLPEDAARAYDKAARELHGEFARTNFE